MKKLKVMAAACGLAIGLTGVANAGLVNYDFTGTVGFSTNYNYSGKSFEAIITFDDSNNKLSNWKYLINNNVIEAFDSTTLSSYSSTVSTSPYFSFSSTKGAPLTSEYINYSLTYDSTKNNNGFLDFTLKDGTATIITASVTKPTVTPIPAAAWLLGSGVLGMVGLKRRKTTAA